MTIFCTEIDAAINERAKKYAPDKDNTENTDTSPILLFKRFLDDILMIWSGSTKTFTSF